jgi:hypothetical protein
MAIQDRTLTSSLITYIFTTRSTGKMSNSSAEEHRLQQSNDKIILLTEVVSDSEFWPPGGEDNEELMPQTVFDDMRVRDGR